MTTTRESTLALIDRYRFWYDEHPTLDELRRFASAQRQRNKLGERVDALVRGGHVTVDETGRIIRTTGTTNTETM
jgi:hypothetical protein